MKQIILVVSMTLLFLSGCGYKEGVSNTAQKSYLYFSGDTINTLVSIDGGEKFSVKPGENNQYSIKPGKHLIEVYRNGSATLKRTIYIADGIAKEIEVN